MQLQQNNVLWIYTQPEIGTRPNDGGLGLGEIERFPRPRPVALRLCKVVDRAVRVVLLLWRGVKVQEKPRGDVASR